MKTSAIASQKQKIRQILDESWSEEKKMQHICTSLAENFAAFDWVGFYMVDPKAERELVLGPFVGAPTDHTRIPFGRGICGQAAESKKTFVVDDVSEADNYLACNMNVKAEIVLPILKENVFVGELDIDSHQKKGITQAHKNMLEEICAMIGDLF